MRRAYVVLGMGFGDEGKGAVTDALVRKHNAKLVVRFNGGAQAGHNVVLPDGRHHTFSQWGSGTFVPGCLTYLSEHTILHPGAMVVEAEKLIEKDVIGAWSRLIVNRGALVITPFHQTMNQLRETARQRTGDEHGSCGIGVGETVADRDCDDSIRWRDLSNFAVLLQKLHSVQERKRHEALLLGKSEPSFEDRDIVRKIAQMMFEVSQRVRTIESEDEKALFNDHEKIIFEGAQGVLLDEWYGFHPHTTWSNTTAANARFILAAAGWDDVTTYGLLRAFATRHGTGPFPTEFPIHPEFQRGENNQAEFQTGEHNKAHSFQGKFRYGHFDSVLARYAIEADGGVDGLIVTCVDRIAQTENKICVEYEIPNGIHMNTIRMPEWRGEGFDLRWDPPQRHLSSSEIMVESAKFTTAEEARLSESEILKDRENIGKLLRMAKCWYQRPTTSTPDSFLKLIENHCHKPILGTSAGPTFQDKAGEAFK